jgi:hypothetical protein
VLKSETPSARRMTASVAVLQRGLDDPRIATAPIVTVAGEQVHAIPLAGHDQAVDPMQAQRAESC